MTITTRQDKVNATITRLNARLEKLKNMTPAQKAKKYDPKGIREDRGEYWYNVDIESLENQIAQNFKKLAEAKRLDEKEEATKAKKNTREIALSNIPECLKVFADDVEARMIADELRLYNLCKGKEYPSYKDGSDEANLIRHYHFFDEEKMRKDVKRTVEDLVLNLLTRAEKKCGNIINTERLSVRPAVEGCAINGWIEGDKGNAYVESIYAGGYNIQRLHVRVLVK